MKASINKPRLIERRSDERNVFELINQMRDGLLNRTGTYNFIAHTDDAVPKTIWQMNLVPQTTITVEVTVAAWASAGIGAGYRRFGAFRLGTAAPSVQIGAIDVIDKEDDPLWDVTLATDFLIGVALQVTGVALAHIDWFAHIAVVEAPAQVIT